MANGTGAAAIPATQKRTALAKNRVLPKPLPEVHPAILVKPPSKATINGWLGRQRKVTSTKLSFSLSPGCFRLVGYWQNCSTQEAVWRAARSVGSPLKSRHLLQTQGRRGMSELTPCRCRDQLATAELLVQRCNPRLRQQQWLPYPRRTSFAWCHSMPYGTHHNRVATLGPQGVMRCENQWARRAPKRGAQPTRRKHDGERGGACTNGEPSRVSDLSPPKRSLALRLGVTLSSFRSLAPNPASLV